MARLILAVYDLTVLGHDSQPVFVAFFFFFFFSFFLSLFSLLQPLKENTFVIPKSRYDSISTYLSPEGIKYSDIDLVYDTEIYQQLVDAG